LTVSCRAGGGVRGEGGHELKKLGTRKNKSSTRGGGKKPRSLKTFLGGGDGREREEKKKDEMIKNAAREKRF